MILATKKPKPVYTHTAAPGDKRDAYDWLGEAPRRRFNFTGDDNKSHQYQNAGIPCSQDGGMSGHIGASVCTKCGHGFAELISEPKTTICNECRWDTFMDQAFALQSESGERFGLERPDLISRFAQSSLSVLRGLDITRCRLKPLMWNGNDPLCDGVLTSPGWEDDWQQENATDDAVRALEGG